MTGASWSLARRNTVLHLGKNNPRHQYMLGAAQLEISLTEKNLPGEHQVEHQPPMCPGCKEGERILVCHRQSIDSSLREVILLCQHWWPHLECCVQLRAPCRGDRDMWGETERAGTVQLGEQSGESQCVNGGVQREWIQVLFSGALWQDQRWQATLKHKRLPLNIRNHFFTAKETEQMLPRGIVRSSSLKMSKSCPYTVLGVSRWVCLSRWVEPCHLPRSLPTSTTLWF